MHAIDSTMLLLLFRPAALVPTGPDGKQILAARQRVEHLIETLDDEGVHVIVPTPVLSELLIRGSDEQLQSIPAELAKRAVFQVEPFDVRAAVELAKMNREDLPTKKRSSVAETAAKMKLDRQIVAVAKVHGATVIYSDDKSLCRFAKRHGMKAIGLADLPIPAEMRQVQLFEAEEG